MSKIPETDLMAEFNKGNILAYKQVYDEFFPALCFFARRLVNDQPEGEEIAAETFVKLFKLHPNFESKQNIKAFLYITTRNACLNFLKHIKRLNVHKKGYAYLQQEADEENVLSAWIHAEVVREVRNEIENLPRACKAVFKLLFYEGLKAKEVAEKLNISINTVWGQRARAIELIRVSLLKKGIMTVYLGFLLLVG